MSQNELIEAQGAAEEIPQAELAEGELESVAGGSAWLLIAGGPVVAAVAAVATVEGGTVS
jgi:hypothetical protein